MHNRLQKFLAGILCLSFGLTGLSAGLSMAQGPGARVARKLSSVAERQRQDEAKASQIRMAPQPAEANFHPVADTRPDQRQPDHQFAEESVKHSDVIPPDAALPESTQKNETRRKAKAEKIVKPANKPEIKAAKAAKKSEPAKATRPVKKQERKTAKAEPEHRDATPRLQQATQKTAVKPPRKKGPKEVVHFQPDPVVTVPPSAAAVQPETLRPQTSSDEKRLAETSSSNNRKAEKALKKQARAEEKARLRLARESRRQAQRQAALEKREAEKAKLAAGKTNRKPHVTHRAERHKQAEAASAGKSESQSGQARAAKPDKAKVADAKKPVRHYKPGEKPVVHFPASEMPVAVANPEQPAVALRGSHDEAIQPVSLQGKVRSTNEREFAATENASLKPEKSRRRGKFVPPPTPEQLRERALVVRHYNWAGTLGAEGKFEQSIAEYKRVLLINPGVADAYVGLAAAYGNLQDWESVFEYGRKALERKKAHFMDPRNAVQAHYNLSTAYCVAGDYGAARKHLKQVMKANHPNARMLESYLETNCKRSTLSKL